jgi:hypothetical protein
MLKKDKDIIGELKGGPKSEPPLFNDFKRKLAYVNVFIDGTLNNYYNTKLMEGAELKDLPNNDTSYDNDYTNVARMWNYLENDRQYKNAAYIEGMGTKRHDEKLKTWQDLKKKDVNDEQEGYAFGDGETGVLERAKSVFLQLHDKVLDGDKSSDKFPVEVRINVFGFSRGAAAARTFVQLIHQKRYDLFKDPDVAKLWRESTVRVNFVGLYDTVSSYAANHATEFDANANERTGVVPHGKAHTVFHNDVQQLHLNFEPGSVGRVVHIVAGDEFRRNFPSTNIKSTIGLVSNHGSRQDRKVGYELTIPGAHSDIGGSYWPKAEERRVFYKDKVLAFVTEKGFYEQADLYALDHPECSKKDWEGLSKEDRQKDYQARMREKAKGYRVANRFGDRQSCNYLFEGKRQVYGQYHKVALAVMVDKFNEWDVGVRIEDSLFEVKVKPDNDGEAITAIQQEIRNFAKDENNTKWTLEEKASVGYTKKFRRHCLHLSAVEGLNEGLIKWLAYDYDDELERTPING